MRTYALARRGARSVRVAIAITTVPVAETNSKFVQGLTKSKKKKKQNNSKKLGEK